MASLMVSRCNVDVQWLDRLVDRQTLISLIDCWKMATGAVITDCSVVLEPNIENARRLDLIRRSMLLIE